MASTKKSLSLAILLHVAILSFLVIELNFSATDESKPTSLSIKQDETPIVHATAISQQQIEKQVTALQEQEQQRKLEQQQQLEKMQQAAEAARQEQVLAQQQMAALKQQQAEAAQQQQRLAELKAKQEQEQKKLLAQQEQQKKQKELEDQQKAQALAQKKQKELEEQQKAQALAQKKQKELEDQQKAQALAQKKQQLAEQQKAAAAEAEQKKKMQAEAERLLQQQLASDQQQLNAAKQQMLNKELARYASLIKNAIGNNWNVPQNVAANLSCVLLIRLSDNGHVLAVQLVKTSGDPVLDRSAEAAVYKASPLPVPDNPEIMQMVREIRLTLTPKLNSIG